MKKLTKTIVLSLLAAALAGTPALSGAQDTNANQMPASGQTAPKSRSLVFRGKISAIDATASTLTVGKRTFGVTAETKILRDGKPATLADGQVGEPVSGAYRKSDDGKLIATTLHLGAKAEQAPAAGGTP